MGTWILLLKVLHVLSVMALFGGLLWLTLLRLAVRRRGEAEELTIDSALKRTGSIQGVALATVIYTGLALYWLQMGDFVWRWGSPWERAHLLKALLFLVFWVYWGWTEVVGLDSLRKHAPAPDVPTSPDYLQGRARAWRAVWWLLVQAAVLVVIALLAGELRRAA